MAIRNFYMTFLRVKIVCLSGSAGISESEVTNSQKHSFPDFKQNLYLCKNGAVHWRFDGSASASVLIEDGQK